MPKRFGIRFLFTMTTLVCVWLGFAVYRISERSAMRQFLTSRGDTVSLGSSQKPWKKMPLLWELLGAEPVSHINATSGGLTDEDRELIRKLFPEADVVFD
jgi:hypothetical protein